MVSKGQLVTLSNFTELFKDVLNPKQLEGLRLLVTPFPQAQLNLALISKGRLRWQRRPPSAAFTFPSTPGHRIGRWSTPFRRRPAPGNTPALVTAPAPNVRSWY